MSVRDTVTGAISNEDRSALVALATDTDLSNADPAVIERLRIEGFIYTVANDEAGTYHGHLKDRGKEALGLPTTAITRRSDAT